MINKFKCCFLYLLSATFFIQCTVSKKAVKINIESIIGVYVNKVKAAHFKEDLELLRDYRFRLTTQYEWTKYEYNGIWQIKADTLMLQCDNGFSVESSKYFKPFWLINEKQNELILINNQSYSLVKKMLRN